MPNLSQIHFDLGQDEDLCTDLRNAFSKSKMTLPVKVLKLSRAPNAGFIIKSCPNLRTLIAVGLDQKWRRTFAPLLYTKTLHRLEIDTAENWTQRRIEGMTCSTNILVVDLD
jgi:hypothetical protein